MHIAARLSDRLNSDLQIPLYTLTFRWFTPKDIFPERTCFPIDYLGYLESQACAHINNPRTYIRIHSIYF